MRKAFILLLLVVAGFGFNSCKNDLKILAPYKESVSVYGVLCPQEKIQVIRINKIYLGEGNAYTMAKVSDSINFAPGALTVMLEHFVNGVQAPTTVGNSSKMQIILKDSMVQAQSGYFNTNQMVYVTGDKLYPSGDYKLTIKDNHNGTVFTATTTMIDSVVPVPAFQPLAGPYYPVPTPSLSIPGSTLDYSLPFVNHTVRFYSVPGARQYSPTIRFHYGDSIAMNAGFYPNYIDLNFSNITAAKLDGGEELSFVFQTSSIYTTIDGYLSQAVTPNNLFGRKAIKIDFIIYAGAQDLCDFLQVSAPSTSVAQDKPTYTNINGGYGIFSCKSRLHVSKEFANNWLNYMSQNRPTCTYKFLDATLSNQNNCN